MSPADVANRLTGPFGNPNAFGQLLAYGMVLAIAWFTITTSSRLRTMLVVAVGILGWALAESLSRGGAATLLAGLVVLAFARGRTIGIAAVTFALAVVIVGYPLFVEFRLTTERGAASSEVLGELNASDEGRLDAILAGPELFATSPIFGVGFGQYQYASASLSGATEGLVAHNWYGTVLAELGLVGIVLWLAILLTVSRWLRRRPKRPRSIGFAVFGAFTVGCLFLQPPTSFQLSTLPIIAIAAALLADWGEGDAAAEAEPRRQSGSRGTRHAPARRSSERAARA
jgi:O-antigen ligase